MSILVKNPVWSYITVEFHDPEESKMYESIDFDGMDFIGFPMGATYTNLKMNTYRKINSCDPENKQKRNLCMERFITSKIECNLPWSKVQGTFCY